MSNAQGVDLNGPGGEGRRGLGIVGAQPRAVGSPLPIGSGRPAALSNGAAAPRSVDEPPAPGRALAGSAAAPPAGAPSGMQRFVSAIRPTLPLVQRILPLLDGNIGTA